MKIRGFIVFKYTILTLFSVVLLLNRHHQYDRKFPVVRLVLGAVGSTKILFHKTNVWKILENDDLSPANHAPISRHSKFDRSFSPVLRILFDV